jgi:branched-chain amino acid transport system ATP-binding protein
MLETKHLRKRFGGVLACDSVSLEIRKGELHAIIGPNGAGKSTLIGLLAGEIKPNDGQIIFDEKDITSLPTYRRSTLGLARTFQITSLFQNFTVLDNVALAIQGHAGHSFRFWTPARGDVKLRAPARGALSRVGLEYRADTACVNLSHGEHRQLEIAMAIAAAPRTLLLDEPMAGLGPEESARMLVLLKELKRELTILLVEHDMDAVFQLADRITVLVNGRMIASGAPADVRADAEVRRAYLGEQKVRHE